VVSGKHVGEPRIAVLGGSTAFGYGVTWGDAFPAALERALNVAAPQKHWSVVNLGYNNEGAYSFRFTLEDFRYLTPDLVVLYEGYNDILGDIGPNTALYRHDSPIFMLTGYMPILPVVFKEKALALRHSGNLDAGYADAQGHGKVVFHPDLAARASASALGAAVALERTIERQLSALSTARTNLVTEVAAAVDCAEPWRHYCTAVATAVEFALSRHEKVVVAGQPRLATALRARQQDQQRALSLMLQRRFAHNGDVHYVDLGDAVDLSDPRAAPDGMHLNAAANRRLAQQLVAPVLELLGVAPSGIDRHP
jgi:lysophospholipase L1-like esterase